MDNFVKLSCPSCGSTLKVTSDVDRFACAHCGSEWIVKRGGGIVSLSPVVEGLKKVQTGVDKTASELAIRRLQEELREVNNQIGSLNMEAQYHRQEMSNLKWNRLYTWLGQLIMAPVLAMASSGFVVMAITSILHWDPHQMYGWMCAIPLIVCLLIGLILSWLLFLPIHRGIDRRIAVIEKAEVAFATDLPKLNQEKTRIENEIAMQMRVVAQ